MERVVVTRCIHGAVATVRRRPRQFASACKNGPIYHHSTRHTGASSTVRSSAATLSSSTSSSEPPFRRRHVSDSYTAKNQRARTHMEEGKRSSKPQRWPRPAKPFQFSRWTMDESDGPGSMLRHQIKERGRHEQWAAALSVFRAAQKAGRVTMTAWIYSAVLHALGNNGRIAEGKALLREMHETGVVPTRSCFNHVLYACCEVGDLETAQSIVEEMDRLSINADTTTYRNLLNIYGSAGKVEDVMSMLEDLIEQGQVAAYHFQAAMRACRIAGQGERSLALLDRMQIILVEHNAGVYVEAIKACSRSALGEDSEAKCDRAWSIVFEEMRANLERPSVDHYAALMDVLGDGAKIDEALILLGNFSKRGHRLDSRVSAAAIGVFGKAGRWEKAMTHLRSCSTKPLEGPLIACYIAAVEARALHGQWRQALELVRETTSPPGPKTSKNKLRPHSDVHKWAIHACAAAGQLDKAVQLVDEMPSIGLSVHPKDHLEPVLCACLKSGDWEKALALVTNHKNRVLPGAAGFGATALVCANAGQWENGYQVLQNAVEAGVTGISEDAIVAVMKACTEAEQPQRALHLLDQFKNEGESRGEMGKAAADAEAAAIAKQAACDIP